MTRKLFLNLYPLEKCMMTKSEWENIKSILTTEMPPAIAASMATSALYVDENKKVSQHKSELKNSID